MNTFESSMQWWGDFLNSKHCSVGEGAFRSALIIPITNSAPQYTTLQVYTTWKNTKTGIAFLKWTCFTVQSYDFLKINIMSSIVYDKTKRSDLCIII